MKQDELEQKVTGLFERQGFEVKKKGNVLIAENDNKLELNVFSSEKFSDEEVLKNIEKGQKVFVDEGLEIVKNSIENDISVLNEEKEEPEYETPSYEVIGDIAVINDLVDIEKNEAVDGILHHQPSIKTILLKEEGLSGEFRVGDYQKLYGEETETIHKEHGCRYKVDPTKMYFSERFATERERVISKIENGENVLVMFAGVGPFAIMAARNANPEKVVAIEKNPEGASFLKDNIELNKVEDVVEGFEGDVKDVLSDLEMKFDRVIMPLPGSANKFLSLAMNQTKKDGIIHYYRFLEDKSWSRIENEIESTAKSVGREFEINNRTICGQRAANIDGVFFDLEIK